LEITVFKKHEEEFKLNGYLPPPPPPPPPLPTDEQMDTVTDSDIRENAGSKSEHINQFLTQSTM